MLQRYYFFISLDLIFFSCFNISLVGLFPLPALARMLFQREFSTPSLFSFFIVWTKIDIHSNEDPEGKFIRMDKGPNHTFSIDFEGRKKYDERIQRGLTLFGKYYRNLWD